MDPDYLKEVASGIIQDWHREIGWMSVGEMAEGYMDPEDYSVEEWDEAHCKLDDLIQSAKVTVTWSKP